MPSLSLSRKLFVGLLLCAANVVLDSHPACAQATGSDEFSSGADEFVSGASSPGSYPSSVYAPEGDYFRYGPGAGHWELDQSGSNHWVLDEEGECDDAFTGYQDLRPPARTDEQFYTDTSFGEAASDVFASSPRPGGPHGRYSRDMLRWARSRMPLQVYASSTIDYARDGRVRQIIQECLQTWCKAVGGDARYEMTVDFKRADIFFLQRETENNEWADNEKTYCKDGLNSVRINLLERTVKYLPERRLKAILMHETGHAFGLIDHLQGAQDVMSVCVADSKHPVTVLSAADVEAVHKLYVDPVRADSEKFALRYDKAPMMQSMIERGLNDSTAVAYKHYAPSAMKAFMQQHAGH